MQWVAKMAAAQKEYKAALKNMQRREAGPSDVSKTAAAGEYCRQCMCMCCSRGPHSKDFNLEARGLGSWTQR